jgi:hypothetical protein
VRRATVKTAQNSNEIKDQNNRSANIKGKC